MSNMDNVEPTGVITIDRLGQNLRGFGKLGGKSIEIPYSLVGDVYRVFKFGKRKFFYKWQADSLEKRDVIPKCSHFGQCGGCSGQHLEYAIQFELKFGPIRHALLECGIENFSVQPAVEQYHYRNRMDFAVFPDKIVGLRMAGNFRKIIPLDNCAIQSDWANEEFGRIKILLSEFPGIEYDRKKEIGFLKYVTLRKSVFTDDSMTIFTFTEDFKENSLLEKVAEATKRISVGKNLVFCFNRKKGEISASGESLVLRGRDSLVEAVLGRSFLIPFDGFFQPNPKEFLHILDFVKQRLTPKKTLIDLFCGSGFFSLLFGKEFPSLLGIDVVPSSVSAGLSVLQNEFPDKKLEMLSVDLFNKKGLEKLEATGLLHSDAVLIADPPRSGLSPELCGLLNRSRVGQFFYVSCNPEKLLADLRILSESYEIEDLLVCDPFPHTPHLEAVALLIPKNS